MIKNTDSDMLVFLVHNKLVLNFLAIATYEICPCSVCKRVVDNVGEEYRFLDYQGRNKKTDGLVFSEVITVLLFLGFVVLLTIFFVKI